MLRITGGCSECERNQKGKVVSEFILECRAYICVRLPNVPINSDPENLALTSMGIIMSMISANLIDGLWWGLVVVYVCKQRFILIEKTVDNNQGSTRV